MARDAIDFVKMHGAGNDYVYVDGFRTPVPSDDATLRRWAVAVSDRHTGVGGDGLILVLPDEQADCRMRMFNIDGSEGQMCGNGVRCVAKLAADHGHVTGEIVRVATASGRRDVRLVREDGEVVGGSVAMGEPDLGDHAKQLDGLPVRATLVSTGNPHAVLFVNDLDKIDVPRLGPLVATHPAFPGGINAHFVQVLARDRCRVVHWERGSGPTLACGTGACAVCVAGVVTGRLDREVAVEVPGGVLDIAWDETTNQMRMTGPAATVFSGQWEPPADAVVAPR